MTLPVNSPLRPQDDTKSALATAIEARGRASVVCDVTGFFGPGDKPIPKVAVRVNVKGEEDRAVVDAHRYAADLAKGTEAAKDDDLLREAKVVHALHWAFRMVDEEGKATIHAAFPSPKWMRDNLTSDQLAALLNLYNDVRTRQSPWPHKFEDDDVERLAMLCADNADSELPTLVLARIEREMLSQYLIIIACKLRLARSQLLAAEAAIAEERDAAPAEGAEDPGEELSQ